MSQTYFAILTAIGEAKLANAVALGTQLQVSRMAVGDGNGNLPNPDRLQTALINEQYRADLNQLSVDPVNDSQIIAELVIPETTGGFWLREMGLYDAAGDLIAVSNCPPSYKPELAEGSGRTQVLRMVLIVSSTAAVQLKIDPSVVLATRAYVDAGDAIATQPMAEAGTDNSKKMTPLRVFQAIRSATANATELLRGVLRVGTAAEVEAGILDDVAVTPKKMRLGFILSFGANGYLILPAWMGSFIFQWGSITNSASDIETLLPISYTTTHLHVFVTHGYTPGTGIVGYIGGSPKSLGSLVSRSSNSSLGGRFWSIGK
ncbi:phage tail protein [Pseudomonas sp. NPDC078700]|uniref:phage tail protein n=1 Tax=Pseudomonas sp. NPDC078700 TaxID=3364424 RepID=UPI0037C69577